MSEAIYTRRAGAEDARLLAALHGEIFPHEPWSAAWMGRLLANPANRAMVLVEAGRPVGLALASLAVDEAEILTIGILPDRRGGGLGARLLADLVASLRAAGAARLFLEVSAQNAPALGLYQAAGFERTGARRRYYADGSDAVTMALARMPAG